MAIFGPKPWVNPFGKMSIFRLFKLLLFIAYKERFLVLEYYKRHLPCLYCLEKKVGKMAIFGPKPWVNPFGKNNVNFSTFWTSCIYSLERRFFVLEYHKGHYPGLYWRKKKNWKNGHFLDQNHGLTPLEKCQFVDFLDWLFL